MLTSQAIYQPKPTILTTPQWQSTVLHKLGSSFLPHKKNKNNAFVNHNYEIKKKYAKRQKYDILSQNYDKVLQS